MRSYLKMVIPLTLAFGVGMVAAQTKAGERIGGKEKQARINTVTIDDGTLYPLAPKKGASVVFDNGDVTYTVCRGAICADSANFFTEVKYSWQRLDINDSSWKHYAYSDGSETFVPGEYRLVADYERSKWHATGIMTALQRRNIAQLAATDYNNHVVDSAQVNGAKFSALGCKTGVHQGFESGKGGAYATYDYFWSCSFASPSITVGKAKPIVFKTFCNDGSKKCSAEYTGPAASFEGDTVKFTVKNTNLDYGRGPLPEDVCKGISIFGYNYDNCGSEYAEYLVSVTFAMTLPINSSSLEDMNKLYLTRKDLAIWADGDMLAGETMSFAYVDTSASADTIYYPLTLRNIDINYVKADHGTVTGPAKAHDGEYLVLSIVPEDGYDVDTLYSKGMDENNVMKYNLESPQMGELMPDGSRYGLFLAQKGFEQNIYAEFKKVGQEVTMVKPTNGTYSVTSRGKEHNASEKLFLTNAAGSTISIKPTPDAGYAVKAVTCEYEMMIEGFDNPSPAVVLLSKDSTTGLYNCAIPDASVLSEDVLNRTKQIMVKVEFAKVNDIKLDITGLGTVIAYVYGAYDPATSEGPYCSNVTDTTSDAGKSCTALEGDSIVIDVEAYAGHPLKSLTCKVDGKTSTNCMSSKAFKMLDKDVDIKATFQATDYTLAKTGVTDDFDLYVGWASDTPTTTAHQFDTVFVRSVDGKHIPMTTAWENRGFKYDSSAKIYVPYFIMDVGDIEVEVTESNLRNTVKQTIKVAGRGTVQNYNLLIGYEHLEVFSMADGNEISARVPTNTMHSIGVVPVEGYSFDTTGIKCSYKDGSELSLNKQEAYASFLLTQEQDYTCEITFTPNSYKITSTADENGVLQNVPKKGNTDELISFKAAPLTGYEVDFVKAYYMDQDTSDTEVAVLLDLTSSYDKKKNVYTYKFTMPARDVAIEAAFKEITSSSSSAKSSSSSVKSSSSKAKSSSSSVKAKSSSSSAKAKSSSSSAKAKSSSSKGGKKNALPAYAQAPLFSLTVMGRSVQIAGATVGSAYSVLDMQGKVIASGTIDAANVNMAMPHAGTFLVRVGNQTQTANIK